MSHRSEQEERGEVGTSGYGYGERHVQTACMCGCLAALFMAHGCISVAILAMTDQNRKNDTHIVIYDWDKNIQGIILSSYFWGYVVMQVPAGLLGKRYGGKTILTMSLVCNAVVYLLLPTVTELGGWQMVCLGQILMGLTQACGLSNIYTLIGQWLPDRERTFLSGIIFSGANVGTILAMPLTGILAESTYGWKLIFYVVSAIMFAASGLWYFYAANSPNEHRNITLEEKLYIERGLNVTAEKTFVTPWRHILSTKAVWAILFAHAGAAISNTFFFVDMTAYLKSGLNISLENSAVLSALPYVGGWVVGVSSSYACEYIFNRGYVTLVVLRKTATSIAFFGSAMGLILLSFLNEDHKHLAVVTLIAIHMFTGFVTAGFVVNHLDLSPNYAGVTMSITNLCASLASLLTPLITSFVLHNDPADVARWHQVFLLIAAISVFVNIVYLLLGSATRQYWDDPNYFNDRNADGIDISQRLC